MESSAQELTPARRRELRALAHGLKPVASIGNNGLTEPVLHEIDRCLAAHELIKIRVHAGERDHREALLAKICALLAAAPVQHIGHLLVVWRVRPAAEVPPELKQRQPRRKAPQLTKKAAAAKTDKAARSRKIVMGKPRRPTRI